MADFMFVLRPDQMPEQVAHPVQVLTGGKVKAVVAVEPPSPGRPPSRITVLIESSPDDGVTWMAIEASRFKRQAQRLAVSVAVPAGLYRARVVEEE